MISKVSNRERGKKSITERQDRHLIRNSLSDRRLTSRNECGVQVLLEQLDTG